MAGFKYEQNQEGTDYFIVKTRRADVIEDLSRMFRWWQLPATGWPFGPNPKK
jgi:hypothetical protein